MQSTTTFDLKPTLPNSEHHVTIHCIKCNSLLANQNEIQQVTPVTVLTHGVSIGITESPTSNSKRKELRCTQCKQFIGHAENNTEFRLFINNMMSKQKEQLLSYTGSQENHTINQKAIKDKIETSTDKLKRSIESVDLSNLTQKELVEMELNRREEFARYNNFKLKDEDFSDELFEQRLSQYEDKKAKVKWQSFSTLLKKDFNNHPRLYRKFSEVIVSHILRDLKPLPAFKTLINASDELIRERIFSKLINDYKNALNAPPLKEIHGILADEFADQYIVYVDLSKANFNALKLFDPAVVLNFDTWQDLVRRETDSELLINSPTIRHKLFGKINYQECNGRNIVVRVQHEVLNALYYELINTEGSVLDASVDSIFQCSCDEVFIRTTKDRLNMVFDFVQSYIRTSSFANITHIGSFLLHKYTYDSNNEDGHFYVKQFIHKETPDQEELEIQGVMKDTREFAHLHFKHGLNHVKQK
jgi:BMFP domain-containing protein YqiC